MAGPEKDAGTAGTVQLAGQPAVQLADQPAIAAQHQVRPYAPADLDALHTLDQRCFAQGIAYSRDELRFFLGSKSSMTWIAEKASEIGGFLIAQIYPAKPTFQARIITIDVGPEHRRLGLGSLLMRECEVELRRAQVRRVRLEVAVGNAAAIAFYVGLGYQNVGRLPEYYPTGEAALAMQKTLQECASA